MEANPCIVKAFNILCGSMKYFLNTGLSDDQIKYIEGSKTLPRVDERLDRKTPFVIRLINDVFPTAASPANTTSTTYLVGLLLLLLL